MCQMYSGFGTDPELCQIQVGRGFNTLCIYIELTRKSMVILYDSLYCILGVNDLQQDRIYETLMWQ